MGHDRVSASYKSRFPLQKNSYHNPNGSEYHQMQQHRLYAGIAQLVEHDLAKVGVASSNLVSRSKKNSVC